MTTHGNDPAVHFIRDGRFVCTAEPTAKCRNYPGCGCEEWSGPSHGDRPAPGHEDAPQSECWLDPWLTSYPLCDAYAEGCVLDDSDFPDGPVTVEWDSDFVTWTYADGTDPLAAFRSEVTA